MHHHNGHSPHNQRHLNAPFIDLGNDCSSSSSYPQVPPHVLDELRTNRGMGGSGDLGVDGTGCLLMVLVPICAGAVYVVGTVLNWLLGLVGYSLGI